MLRRLAWTALTTVMTSVAAGLAFRLAERIWVTVARQPPPRRGLPGFLVRRPLEKRIFNAMRSPVP